jgi:hypothetical protein
LKLVHNLNPASSDQHNVQVYSIIFDKAYLPYYLVLLNLKNQTSSAYETTRTEAIMNYIYSTVNTLRDRYTPVSHKSTFRQTGQITPEEFLAAGDYLVY